MNERPTARECVLLPILEEALRNQEIHLLKVESNTLTIAQPGAISRLQATFGYGEWGSKNIATFIETHWQQLVEEARIYFATNKKIGPISDLIMRLCEAGDGPTFDLAATIFSDWMGQLPPAIQQQSIKSLLLPGTHNSATSEVWLDMPIIQEGEELLASLSKAMDSLPGSMLVDKWAINQHESIQWQLEHGVRLLDLQIAYNQKDHQFYIAERFVSAKLATVLQDIRNFLLAHPREIIYININPAWDYRHGVREHHAEAAALLNYYLHDLLAKSEASFEDSIQNLIANNERALLLTEKPWDRIMSASQHQIIQAWYGQKDELPKAQAEEIRYMLQDSALVANYIHFAPQPDWKTMILYKNLQLASEAFNSNLGGLLEDYSKANNAHLYGITLDYPSVSEIENVISHNLYEW